MGELESAPDQSAATAEDRPAFLGARRGADVEVLGLTAQEEVADAAPDEIGREPLSLQAGHDGDRVAVQ
jgi:hypothetical protein